MRLLLELFAVPSTRAPRATLLVLVALTLAFGGAATQLEVSTSLGDFAPEGGVADALDDIEERFGAGSSLQLIVDTGEGGDVLTRDNLVAGQELADALSDDAELAPLLAEEATDQPPVVTYAEPFVQAAEVLDQPLADLDAATLDELVRGLLEDEDARAQVEPLLADDLEVGQGVGSAPRARGGLGIVALSPDLTSDEVADASAAVERITAEVQAPGLRVSVLSDAAIEAGIADGIARDIPVLLSISLLLVLGTLIVLFRSVSDVAVGLVGLVATIVWMVGTAALLGPGVLGIVGPFGQTSIAVPVLLVGLGVDYSVHLTERYREQQARGDAPEQAARTTLHTVGVALVLATVATVGGFLANLSTPLPPIADLGIFSAIGIVAAFVIFGLAVPATRVLLDRRRSGDHVASSPAVSSPASTPRWAAALTAATFRHPVVVLVAGTVALAVAGSAALGLGTEFDDREFLPDGAPITATIDRTDVLFGGDVGESTYVLVAGDTTDPTLLAEAGRLHDEVATLDAVRRAGDEAQITSAFELVDRLADRGARVQATVASDLEAWDDPEAAAADLPIPDELPADTVEDAIDGAGDGFEVPDELADALEPRLPADRSPALALALTGDPEVLQDAARDQYRDELVADRPAGLSDEAVARLSALDAGSLTNAALEAEGYPLDELDADDRDALATLEALRQAGWDEDDPSRDGDDLAAQFEVVRTAAPDELGDLLDADGLLLTVSTDVGQEGASALADELDDLGDELAPNADVTAVSQLLVQAEIIDSLSAAQLQSILISIAIAGALLVISTVATDRSVVLGLIGVAPAASALVLVLGTMRALGLSFNALTATVASIAVGIGVPYGIHLTNRFRASLTTEPSIRAAIADTLGNTGAALAGSAITTGLAFGVLGLSSSVPLRQFGLVSALMITYALVSCLVLQPTLLALWARRRVGRDEDRPTGASDDRSDLVSADR